MRNKVRGLRAMCAEALVFLLAALLFGWALLLPVTALAAPALNAEESRLWEAYESGELVRLHILADGDDAESQRVKLLARDAVLLAFGAAMREIGAQSADAAYAWLWENAESMRAVAARCAHENGFEGPVRAEVGCLSLPEKRYGRVVLPEGEYRALRITLGSGKGRNWWCVLFPQICLAIAGEDETTAETEAPSSTDDASPPPELVWDGLRVLKNWLFPTF